MIICYQIHCTKLTQQEYKNIKSATARVGHVVFIKVRKRSFIYKELLLFIFTYIIIIFSDHIRNSDSSMNQSKMCTHVVGTIVYLFMNLPIIHFIHCVCYYRKIHNRFNVMSFYNCLGNY